MLNLVISKYQSLYRPGKFLCIDEAMIPFKGRLSFKQYMANKPTKWGIKIFQLADSRSRFVSNLLPYGGKNTIVCPPSRIQKGNVSVPSAVVMQLSEPYHYEGFTVVTDNYFTSPELAREMEILGSNVLGTVRTNRKGLPSEITVKSSSQVKGLKRGDALYSHNKKYGMTVVTWKDTKVFSVLTTCNSDKSSKEITRYQMLSVVVS